MKMKKNLLKMALLAFATFAASVASAQTYSGKITSSDWSGDKGLESDVDYSLTYIESTKKLNFEFTVPCDKKINVAYFFAEHGFGETTIGNPQSVDGHILCREPLEAHLSLKKELKRGSLLNWLLTVSGIL